jgi:hypothetical protein
MLRNLKKVSVLLGTTANVLLWAWVFDYSSWVVTGLLGLVSSCAHFYFMEIDYKWVMQIRPYGWTPVFVAWTGVFFLMRYLVGF